MRNAITPTAAGLRASEYVQASVLMTSMVATYVRRAPQLSREDAAHGAARGAAAAGRAAAVVAGVDAPVLAHVAVLARVHADFDGDRVGVAALLVRYREANFGDDA